MKIAATTFLVSCLLLVVSGSVLFPCAPDCSEHHTVNLFPNPHDCTKYFQCAQTVVVPRHCPDGQWFNAAIQVCDYPDSSGCEADPDLNCGAPTTTVAPPLTTTVAATTTVVPQTTTAGSGPTTTDGGEDCVPPCPSAEAMFPNPRDCGSFFKCAHGVPYFIRCPPDLYYSLEDERCEYPEDAKCTAGPDTPCVAVTNPPQLVNIMQ